MPIGLPSRELDWSYYAAVTPAERYDLRKAYTSAAPFPHLVLDGLFPADHLRQVAEDFDTAAPGSWRAIQSGLQKKRATPPDSALPAYVQEYFNTLNSGPFIRFLSDITGIANLIPDPALHGGGMHEVEEGGAFEIHIDFEQHPRTLLSNRLVVITYLNDGWTPDDGGDLELWFTKPPRCAASVMPVFGRTVIMEQSRLAAHGHPRPIGPGRKRRSVTAYFYTNGRAPATASNLLPTTYVAHRGYSVRKRVELALRLVAPPILLMGVRSVTTKAHNVFVRAD
jgi:hypothetical protein